MSKDTWIRLMGVPVALAISVGFVMGQGTTAPTTGGGGGTTGGTAPGGGAGGGATGGGGRVGTTPTTTQPSNQPMQIPQQRQQVVFLSGRVVTDDGSAPPESVVIERVCLGEVRPTGHSDSKGRFDLQLGQNETMFMDASVSGSGNGFGPDFGPGALGGTPNTSPAMAGGGPMNQGITEQQLQGCELRANLAGWRSDYVSLASRRLMDHPDVGIIVIHKLGATDGSSVSATSMQAPKEAKKSFEKGTDLFSKKKTVEAEKELTKAVGLYPKYAEAWNQLGMVYTMQGKKEEARNAFNQALAADSRFVKPYVSLAEMWVQESKWQETADTTAKLVKLDPFDYPQAFFYNSIANYNLKNFDKAEESAREAVKLDRRHQYPRAQHLLGIILAMKDDFKGALENFKGYLQAAPMATDADQVKKQIAEVERLMGQTESAQQGQAAPAAAPQQ